MKPESLVQLVGSGNTAAVEDEWMRIIDAPDVPLLQLAEYDVVLGELCRVGNSAQAEAFAWAAIEAVSARRTALEALTVAGPFLLTLGESEDVRQQVVELFRAAHADCEGLERLLGESGLGGGRPVRRALRTLEVCLPLNEGDFLAARDDDGAARIERICRATWQFTITGVGGAQTLGAVELADRYRPASPTEFRVMRVFAPDQLIRRLWDDPVSIVIDICREHDDSIDTDTLEATLVPELLSDTDWKKWWARARNPLKRCANLKIEGRSPYYLTYVRQPIALEDDLLEEFEKLHDPLAQLDLVEKYLRECKARKEQPSEPALRRCYESFAKRARRLMQEESVQAGLLWVIARWVGEAAGSDAPPDEAIDLFRSATDLKALFARIEKESLLDRACTLLVEAWPDDWPDRLTALLPTFPLAIWGGAVGRLVEAGRGAADFEPLVQQIVGSPAAHFEGMLWLWDGPSHEQHIPVPPPVTLLSSILRTLDECRRSDRIPKETARKISTRARAVLSARKYERFERCLEGLDADMAGALRTQIKQLDNLGRAVREDLLNRLERRFPSSSSRREVPLWSRDDVLYVTEAGLARKQEEIDHHVNVKMKENARAIGRAAEHGDLSENAEFRFALEERDLLRARLAQMNAEAALARVITPDDVPTDHAGIGSKVIFKRATDGERYEMSILGPWEADPANGIFNYQSPLARKVLGKRIGETVEFDHTGAVGAYEIVALQNALASGEQA